MLCDSGHERQATYLHSKCSNFYCVQYNFLHLDMHIFLSVTVQSQRYVEGKACAAFHAFCLKMGKSQNLVFDNSLVFITTIKTYSILRSCFSVGGREEVDITCVEFSRVDLPCACHVDVFLLFN